MLTFIQSPAPANFAAPATTDRSALFADWLSFVDVSANTAATYARQIRVFADFCNAREIATPTRETLIDYRAELLATGKQSSTAAVYFGAAKMFVRFLESKGIVPAESSRVKAPKISREHKRDAFSPAQIREILAGTENARDKALIALAATTGLREFSLVDATIADLRNDALAGCVLFFRSKGKTEKADFVRVPAAVEKLLRAYLATRGNVPETAPLFASEAPRNRGEKLTTFSVSRLCKNAFRRAGICSRRLTAHSLRHTAATVALASGEKIEAVADMLAHRNIQTTLIYAHRIARAQSTAENSVAAAIFGAPSAA